MSSRQERELEVRDRAIGALAIVAEAAHDFVSVADGDVDSERFDRLKRALQALVVNPGMRELLATVAARRIRSGPGAG